MGASVMTAHHPAAMAFDGGHMRLVAANGSEVRIDYVGGMSSPGLPDVGEWYDVWVDATIVGGTGRFAHASGSADMTVSLQYLGIESPVWPEIVSWRGTIRY